MASFSFPNISYGDIERLSALRPDSVEFDLLLHDVKQYLIDWDSESWVDDDEIYSLGAEISSLLAPSALKSLTEKIKKIDESETRSYFLVGLNGPLDAASTQSSDRAPFRDKNDFDAIFQSQNLNFAMKELEKEREGRKKYADYSGNYVPLLQFNTIISNKLIELSKITYGDSAFFLIDLSVEGLSYNPDDQTAWASLHRALGSLGRHDLEEIVLWERYRRFPESPYTVGQLADTIFTHFPDRIQEAIELEREYLFISPDDFSNRNRLARYLARSGKSEDRRSAVDVLLEGMTVYLGDIKGYDYEKQLVYDCAVIVNIFQINREFFEEDFPESISGEHMGDPRYQCEMLRQISTKSSALLKKFIHSLFVGELWSNSSVEAVDEIVSSNPGRFGSSIDLIDEYSRNKKSQSWLRSLEEYLEYESKEYSDLIQPSFRTHWAALAKLIDIIADKPFDGVEQGDVSEGLQEETNDFAAADLDIDLERLFRQVGDQTDVTGSNIIELEFAAVSYEYVVAIDDEKKSSLLQLPLEILEMGALRRIRLRAEAGVESLAKMAFSELSGAAWHSGAQEYAEILSYRYGLTAKKGYMRSDQLSGLAVQFERAISNEDVGKLDMLAKRYRRYEALALIVKAALGHDQSIDLLRQRFEDIRREDDPETRKFVEIIDFPFLVYESGSSFDDVLKKNSSRFLAGARVYLESSVGEYWVA